MDASLTEKDYTSRRGELSAFGRATNSSRCLWRLNLVVAGCMVLTLLVAVLLSGNSWVRTILLLAAGVLIAGLLLIWRYTKAHFIDPDLAFRKWLQQVCDGELEAHIELPPSHRHYKELDFHTRNLTSSLRHLSTDMESLVESQTSRLETQNRVLELLFQLTSDVASELDLQSVLNKVCTHLSGWLDGAFVAAYMREEGSLKLRAASGPMSGHSNSHRPAEDLPVIDLDRRENLPYKLNFKASIDETNSKIQIPIFKNKVVVGMVEIVSSAPLTNNPIELQGVFQTVSEQLSVFILKNAALESAHNARLIKERIQFGAELHDSLAQTLLATGYKVKMLRESLSSDSGDPAVSALADVKRIEEMINEANAEVRSLIGEYRKPLSEHRYANAIRKIIQDFNHTSDIEVFFQLDNPGILFTAREDTVVQRVIGEALNNARKYSKATAIRVYIRVEDSGARSVLIEDDGKGFCVNATTLEASGTSSDHIGLSIMRDRALSIGAILTIESEIDDGTRVFLKLPPLELAEGV